jgi:hypothetical protein
MKAAFSIGLVALLAGCAGAAPRSQNDRAPYGRWEGFLLRNGASEAVSVELSAASSLGDGRLRAGDNAVPLEGLRISGNNVHFEVAGEGAFDGAVAGNTMAGSVSGPVSGSFSLTHVDETWRPYFLGP